MLKKIGQEVICIQEHRFVHLDVDIKEHTFGKWKLLTCSAWRNSINAAIGGVGILINLRAYNAIKKYRYDIKQNSGNTFHGKHIDNSNIML